MKIKIVAVLVMVAASFGWNIEAQIYDTNGDFVQTFAGSAFSGYLDGKGQATIFGSPMTIVARFKNELIRLGLFSESDDKKNHARWNGFNFRRRWESNARRWYCWN